MSDDYKKLLDYIIREKISEFYSEIWDLANKVITKEQDRVKFRDNLKQMYYFHRDRISKYIIMEDC